jgi:hypothetical protein
MKTLLLLSVAFGLVFQSATACVDFAAGYHTWFPQDLIGQFEAALTDNGVQRCQIKGHQLPNMNDFSRTWPIESPLIIPLHCHTGYWAAVALVTANFGVVRYTYGNGTFDGTFTIESPCWIEDSTKLGASDKYGPHFRKTVWNCDYNPVDWKPCSYYIEPKGKDALTRQRLLARMGWNDSSGDTYWKPDTAMLG